MIDKSSKQEFIAKYERWFSYARREELKKEMEADLEALFTALRQPLVSSSLLLLKCECGQNALPYKAQIEIDKCSRCGNDL